MRSWRICFLDLLHFNLRLKLSFLIFSVLVLRNLVKSIMCNTFLYLLSNFSWLFIYFRMTEWQSLWSNDSSMLFRRCFLMSFNDFHWSWWSIYFHIRRVFVFVILLKRLHQISIIRTFLVFSCLLIRFLFFNNLYISMLSFWLKNFV